VTPVFDKAIAFVLGQEGGYTDDPIDPGGETNHGITYETLQKAMFLGLVPSTATPRTLTREEAIAIYRALYWTKIKGDELPPAVAFACFDCGVNQGTDTAARLLQQTLNITDDGVVGDNTVKAAWAQLSERLIDEFTAKRLLRYFRTKNVDRFGFGWIRRAVGTHRRALALLWGVA